MGKMKITPVEEVPYGLYIWQTAGGKLIMDDEGRHLSIAAVKGDIKRIKKLKEVASHYGFPDGSPVWFSGHRQISDEEWENQRQRLEWGLVPDEYDLPALEEDMTQKMRQGIV